MSPNIGELVPAVNPEAFNGEYVSTVMLRSIQSLASPVEFTPSDHYSYLLSDKLHVIRSWLKIVILIRYGPSGALCAPALVEATRRIQR